MAAAPPSFALRGSRALLALLAALTLWSRHAAAQTAMYSGSSYYNYVAGSRRANYYYDRVTGVSTFTITLTP
ncbi:MAG: hypothetical protein EOO65_05240, partial [Methanosarcinales archaeon]